MNSTRTIHSLFLSAWYPNRDDAMSGLFVRKHADALSEYCKVSVLYLHTDVSVRRIEVIFQRFNKVNEILIYYPSFTGRLKIICKPLYFCYAYFVGLKLLFRQHGRPDIIHVNILTRNALPALYLKFFNHIPYVITEHWTRYLDSRNSYKGLFRKILTRIAVRNAASVMPVSIDLQSAMQRHGLKNNNYRVINNVVEDFFFEKQVITPSTNQLKHIVHISCFDDEQKNISGILRVLATLMKLRNDFYITLAGTGKDFPALYKLTVTLQLPVDRIHFTGEQNPEQIAQLIKSADFFLLFSNHENAPVVISESLACGKPVVSTDVGGIPDMINSSNGILVKSGDEVALLSALTTMLDTYQQYDKGLISSSAFERYSYSSVGEKIYNEYLKIVQAT